MDLVLAFVYAAGSLVCHQLPDRSFFVGDRPLPVCARCTGLYLSAAAGFAAWCLAAWLRRHEVRRQRIGSATAVRIVAITALPTLISFLTGLAGLWDGSNVVRAVLAIPLGLSVGAVVAAVLTKDLR